jgi:SDR family mycofactocin-dependent oxidoreductase
MPDLAGKVAFVTGAAQGQGRSHAVELARAGADILAVDICRQLDGVPSEMGSAEDLERTAELVEAEGRRIVVRQADVRDHEALVDAVGAGVGALGNLDIIVANAGICTYCKLEEMSEEIWETMIGVNLTGVWLTVKAALPQTNPGASIVITSSLAGIRGFPTTGHYAAAKHGVVGLMQSLAQEVADRGIRVNTIHPTQVETKMILNDATYKLFSPESPRADVEEMKSVSEEGMVLPTPWVQPEDVSQAVLFLASDSARFITGTTLPVDAGALLK